jgi:hypothetical protein
VGNRTSEAHSRASPRWIHNRCAHRNAQRAIRQTRKRFSREGKVAKKRSDRQTGLPGHVSAVPSRQIRNRCTYRYANAPQAPQVRARGFLWRREAVAPRFVCAFTSRGAKSYGDVTPITGGPRPVRKYKRDNDDAETQKASFNKRTWKISTNQSASRWSGEPTANRKPKSINRRRSNVPARVGTRSAQRASRR